MPIKRKTIYQAICYAYASLSTAHTLFQKKEEIRNGYNFRDRLYKDYGAGWRKRRPLFEEAKRNIKGICPYCGERDGKTRDHLLSEKRGGEGSLDNQLWVCQTCNSSKNKRDLLTWWRETKPDLPPIDLMRRYLKVVWSYCESRSLLDVSLEDAKKKDLPFDLDFPGLTEYKEHPQREWINEESREIF